MKWLRSALDFTVDVTTVIVLEVGALVDEWRSGR